MGYYTQYELHVKDCEKHQMELELLSGYNGLFDDEVKWYDHQDDMRIHSLKYPELLFKPYGEGEESGDIWIEYHKNGKMQRTEARLMFDKFTEELLR